MNASLKKFPDKGDFSAPPRFLIPLSCSYHILIIAVVFGTYVWLDVLSSSMEVDSSK